MTDILVTYPNNPNKPNQRDTSWVDSETALALLLTALMYSQQSKLEVDESTRSAKLSYDKNRRPLVFRQIKDPSFYELLTRTQSVLGQTKNNARFVRSFITQRLGRTSRVEIPDELRKLATTDISETSFVLKTAVASDLEKMQTFEETLSRLLR